MAFLFDSRLALCAVTLFAAGIFAWARIAGRRAGMRLYLRFAAILFASMAVAGFAAACAPEFGPAALAVAALAASLGAAALGLSMLGPRPSQSLMASLLLACGLGLGLAAVLGGRMMFTAAAVLPSAVLMMALSCERFEGGRRLAGQMFLSAVMLGAGGMALVQNALAAALLFFAAALMGVACALQPRVQQQAGLGFADPVSRRL